MGKVNQWQNRGKKDNKKKYTKHADNNIPKKSKNICQHHNYPAIVETYKDPDNQQNKVIMVVCLPGGADNVQIDLDDNGMMVIIKYAWPKTMYDMSDLFKKELTTNRIEIYHPKILSVKNALEKVRERFDVAPQSLIKIKLPIKVQTASDSWTKSVDKRDDGAHVVMVELQGYLTYYNKKLSNHSSA